MKMIYWNIGCVFDFIGFFYQFKFGVFDFPTLDCIVIKSN